MRSVFLVAAGSRAMIDIINLSGFTYKEIGCEGSTLFLALRNDRVSSVKDIEFISVKQNQSREI